MEAWSLHYYDQHGEPNGLGIALANPPAYMQATHNPTGKELRYYAEGEQRYQQLEQVAIGMWHELKEVGCPGFRLGMLRGRLLQLGVNVDD